MNKWYFGPFSLVVAAVGYGIYEVSGNDYVRQAISVPLLPNLNHGEKTDIDSEELTNPNQPEPELKLTTSDPATEPDVEESGEEMADEALSNEEESEEEPEETKKEEEVKTSHSSSIDRVGATPRSAPTSPVPSVASSSGSSVPVAVTKGEKKVDASSTSTTTKDKYGVDQDWFNKIGTHSMGYKYKEYLVMVPANDEIWKERAEKFKKKVPDGQKWWTYWNGYVSKSRITGALINKVCKEALSYSEWTTFWTIGTSRSYFNFLWELCGREDKSKPNGWWYR